MDIRAKIDPISYGFYKDEDAEIAERIGNALLEASKYVEISFNSHILPNVRCAVRGGGYFDYPNTVDYDFSRTKLEKLIEKYPEHEEFFRSNREKALAWNTEAYSNMFSEAQRKMIDSGAMWGGTWAGHSNPDFGRIVNLGTSGIRKILEEGKAKNNYDTDWFYRACEKTLEAIDNFGDRFSCLASELAQSCDDEKDRQRYLKAAEAFKNVPRNPARNFTEAILVFWMIFSFDGIDSPGNFDQYMYRAYTNTEDKAEIDDLMERLWETFHETRTWNLCLSGSDENWNDQSNELTYYILKLAAEKKYETPNITLRVHRNTPDELWEQIAETIASGIGMPALYNDEVVCPALESIGIPPVHSHMYCMNGCNQIDIFGKSHMGLEDGEVVFAKCLEYALHNGVNAQNGEQESVKSGEAKNFKSYEELERACMRQIEYMTTHACLCANNAQALRAKYKPNPFRSCLLEGCLERGIDYRNGGTLYNHGQILAEAIADTGDSLYAVKKLVFEDKKYTMSELIDALNANFEGYERLRLDFANCAKFGNDIEEVDEITARLINRFFVILKRIHTYRGGVYTGGCSPFNRAASYGKRIAALPNGRFSGDPIIADSIGSVPGCAGNSPTELLNSVLKYDHKNAGSGFILNVKFDKNLFDTDTGKQNFIALAKTYFGLGGQQFTATVVDPAELIDAMENPEAHKDLIVRVGGFSARFIDLDKPLQENIVKRSYLNT